MPLDPRIPDGIVPPGNLPMPVVGQSVSPIPERARREAAAIRGAEAIPDADGGITLALPGPEALAPLAVPEHEANLAEGMEDGLLARLAMEVLEGYEADLDSNEAYFQTIQDGLKLLAITNETSDDPFPGASGAIHPMLLIALVRFVANCRGEMQPADGPAKCKTVATPEAAVLEKSQRKERYLNYFLTVEDKGYYRDCDAGWLQLALYGSIFRKVFRCPHTGEPRSRFLTPLNLVVSYHAPDLETAIRATHIDIISTAEALRRQISGYYLEDATFGNIGDEDTPERQMRERVDTRKASDREEDAEQVHLHQHVLLDPAEWGLPEEGPDGLPIPYIVTVDKRTEKVLRIERDWAEDDAKLLRRDTYAHYLMHPGLGFYGWSLLTLMGCTTNTASTLWRQAINTFMLHTFPGGLRVKGMRPDSESLTMGPGEFAEIDTGGVPINQAVMPLPYRDIPASFPPLFETVTMAGQTLGGTQELQIGEGRQDAPVGTTIAMLEAAIKPTAAVFKRLHEAQGHELRMIAARFALEDGREYPYLIDGQRGVALADDFADVADIVPVSDPNIPTQTQRLAMAQAVLQLAMTGGGIIDPRAAHEDMLVTLGKSPQEIERLMPKPGQGQPADVATELANALKGMPLAVAPWQDHAAHIHAHLPIVQQENIPPPVVAAMMSHIGDHVAALYRINAEQFMQEMGMPVPPAGAPLTPEMDAAMARAVAANSDEILALLGGVLGGQAQDPAKMAEIKFKYEELKFKNADSQRKAQETARQDQTELLKLRQESIDAAADRALKEKELGAKLQLEAVKGMAAIGKQQMAGEQAQAATGQQHFHDYHMSEAERRAQAESTAAERAHQQGMAELQHRQGLEQTTTKGFIDHTKQAQDLGHKAGEAKAGREHELRTTADSRQHDMRMAEADRGHQAEQAQADRDFQAESAGIERQASAREAKADRAHQVGIAALGHEAALKKQKMAGETTLKAAAMKPKPAAKPAAKPKKAKRA